jgi:hypothetical protein
MMLSRVFLRTAGFLLFILCACSRVSPPPEPTTASFVTSLPATETLSPMIAVSPTSIAVPTCADFPTIPAVSTPTGAATAIPSGGSSLPFQAFPVQPEEYIALVNGRVIDGTGAPAWLDWIVLIQGERIVATGPDVILPPGARVVDLTGQTILPGMFDMHAHLYAYNGRSLVPQFTAYPRLYLAGGVTTIFTAGDFDPFGAVLARERLNSGAAVGPHVLIGGPYFSGGDAPSWMLRARTPEEMCSYYEQWKDKIDGLKFYTGIPEDQFAVILNTAHADGLIATGHLESVSGSRAIELGLDGIEHGLFSMSEFFPRGVTHSEQYCAISNLDMTDPAVMGMVEALVSQGTYLDPTLVVFQPELSEFQPLVADWEKYLDPGIVNPVRRALQGLGQPACLPEALRKQAQFVKAVHDRGGLIVTGTDPVMPILLPGYALHRELQNLVEAGLSPLEAIRAATLNGAIATRLDSEKGTIAAGKIADLVIVDGRPDEDITAVGNTRLVFKDGIPYLPDVLRKSVEGQIGKDE